MVNLLVTLLLTPQRPQRTDDLFVCSSTLWLLFDVDGVGEPAMRFSLHADDGCVTDVIDERVEEGNDTSSAAIFPTILPYNGI